MRKLKLLYAEDECQTRQDHITYIKSRYDFEIYETDDGIEALNIYKEHKPEIVLSDITMPNMSGLELAKEIRKISKHTKIIILTAHSQQEKLLEAFDSDVVNYLIKPINRQKLRNSIDTAIETLPQLSNKKSDSIMLGENAEFNMKNDEYSVANEVVKLSKSESSLLKLLCKHKNQDISTYDIYLYVWNDFEKEYSPNSVRTLVKKLRRKLPEGVLQNTYGGFYKLAIR